MKYVTYLDQFDRRCFVVLYLLKRFWFVNSDIRTISGQTFAFAAVLAKASATPATAQVSMHHIDAVLYLALAGPP